MKITIPFLLLAALCLSAAPAKADDMPTFKVLMKAGRIIPETLEVPANTRYAMKGPVRRNSRAWN